MAIGDDFTIDYVNKRIYHSSGTDWYTVNQLYSYLQDTFDELDQMDDPVPMTAQTPTDYTLVNGWFLEETSYQYLKGGAIQTSGWNAATRDDGIRILAFNSGGYVNAVSGDIGLPVVGGSTGSSGTLLAYNNTLRKWWIRVDDTGDTFGSSESITITGGTGTGTTTAASVTGENLYANLYTLGTIKETTDPAENEQIYIVQNSTTLTSWWPETGSGTRHIDVLIKVKEASTEIDFGRLTVYLRHYPANYAGDLYDHFSIDVTPGGRNAVPLATSDDLNNETIASSIGATVTDVTIAFVNGTVTHGAVSSGPFTEFETVTWDTAAGSGIMLLDSTGTMTLGNVSGTALNNTDTIAGLTSGASAIASADMIETYTMNKAFDQGSNYPYSVIVDCATRSLSQIYEYFKYVTREGSTFQTYPTTTSSGATLSHTAQDGEHYIRAHEDLQASTTNLYSPVKQSPFGTYAGGKLFGAQGVWLQNMANSDIQAFQLIDNHGSTRTPPNKQNIAVTNLLEFDRVTVFRTVSTTDNTIDKELYTSHATNNTTGAATFEVTTAIAADTPTSGVIRVVNTSDGIEVRYPYSSFTGSIFTLTGTTLTQAYTNTDTAYVPYIDKQIGNGETSASVTVIYAADRGLLIRVRRKTSIAILPFETPGSFISTGFSIAAIRTPDSIVT